MKTSLKKWSRSRCFKIFRAYCISFNSSYVGNFLSSLISKRLYRSSEKEKKEIRCLVFTSSTKREIRKFHVFKGAVTAKKCTKAWCTCRVVVLPILTYWFWPFSLTSPSSLLAGATKLSETSFSIGIWKNTFIWRGGGQRSFSVPN